MKTPVYESVIFVLAFRLSSIAAAQNTTFDPLKYVDPLIGTNNGGNVFAGASLPYSMAKASPDVDGLNTAGFSTDNSNVTGFSHMHDSGTGGNPSLGNFPIFPQICPENEIDNCAFLIGERKVGYRNESVRASPGYFSVELGNGIKGEMTVSEHAALYRFTFPGNKTRNGTVIDPMILLDLTDLSASRQNASISIDEKSGRMMGNGTFIPSFGSGSFVSYFCADFEGGEVRDNGVWVNNRAGTEPKNLFVTRGINLFYIEAGGWVRFKASEKMEVNVRVGVSFLSAEKACKNAEEEIPGEKWDFEGLKSKAEEVWRKKLGVVSIVTGGQDESYLTNFYSAMYRTMMSPQNYTGENPLWKSTEPYFDSFYCIWDAFRSQLPFLTIIDPNTLSEMVRSLLDTYVHLGWLPDCRMSLCKGFTQGGSNADVVLTDAYIKNLTGPVPIDWDLALRAVINDAENEPLDWSNEGRGGLQSWKNLNYIPYLDYDYLGFGTNSRSISRTVEYAYNDYCVSILSSSLGLKNSTTYLSRSSNWRNLFNPSTTSSISGNDTRFVGFLQPKYLNGTWGYQDPIACSLLDTFCSLTSNPKETFEDSIWAYQFFVPHDVASLITLFGGPQAFIDRLTFYHESGLTDIGNEPSFLTVFLYHYAGRPGLSAERVRTFIPGAFNTTESGLPGNDDTGAMASFAAFALMGLFPNPGQDVYFITPPFFQEVAITNPQNGKVARVRCEGFVAGDAKRYVQSAKLDKREWGRSWIGHEFFRGGGLLELVLGDEESEWGTRDEDLPPSVSGGLGGMIV